MDVSIVNWTKYNPRTDIKHPTWFRVENNFYTDSTLFGLDSDGKCIWFVLLAFASQKNCGRFDVHQGFISGVTRVSEEKVISVFEQLQAAKKIEIHTSRRRTESERGRTESERGRTESVTRQDRTGQDRTGQDGTEHGKADAFPFPEATASGKPPRPLKVKPPVPDGSRVWGEYADAYLERYRRTPVRNAKANAQCAHLVTRLGVDLAMRVARFYVGHNDRWYVSKLHMLEYALKDAEKLATELEVGAQMTSTMANHIDRQSNNDQVAAAVLRDWKAKGIA